MNLSELYEIKKELSNFVEMFRDKLGRKERVYWCQLYLSGLILNGERKSIQPMSERLPGGNEQAMQQFVNQSPWDHNPIQAKLAEYMAEVINLKKGVLVLDDTTLPKKGNHSIGVAHQYCGALGKVANCQSIVSWQFCESRGIHFPINGELYLPESWTNDENKMERSGIPAERRCFLKKWEIALRLFDKIDKEKFPFEALVFDAGYGEIRQFLRELDKRNLIFLAQIPENHSFWPLDVEIENPQENTKGRPQKYPKIKNRSEKPLTAKAWKDKLIKEGTQWDTIELKLRSKKNTKAMVIRVKETLSHAFYRPGAERWLIIEKDGKHYKYYSSNAPVKTKKHKLISWAHERWKIEQSYQHLKEELGLDHFEGRSWRGLHHHITLCFMAYNFLTLLRKRKGKKNQSNIA